jgi:hypothetical protein
MAEIVDAALQEVSPYEVGTFLASNTHPNHKQRVWV